MTIAHWRYDPYRYALINHLDTIFRSIGAAFFVTNPVSGILLTISFFIFSPFLAAMCLAGSVAALIAALLLRRDSAYLKVGFFGFNGALVGMYWVNLTPFTWVSFCTMLLAASATVPIMMLLNRLLCMSRFNLPPLSSASLIVTYPSILLLSSLGIAFPPTMIHPPGFGAWFTGEYLASGFEFVSFFRQFDLRMISGISVMMIAIAVHSPASLRSAMRGLAIGLFAAFILGGRSAVWWSSLFIMTTTPVSIALDGFFVAPSVATRIMSYIAIISGIIVWISVVPLFDHLGLPELTVPFFLTTFTFLFLSRLKTVQRLIPGLVPVPLIYVSSPEYSARWKRDLDLAERYWQIISPSTFKRNWEGDMKRRIDCAVDLIMKSKSIVVFTGAGVSTESGIPDYRTHEIHWKQYDSSHFRYEKFSVSEESRQKYWQMSQDFYLVIKQARPNMAHLAMTEFEKLGKLTGIITQNVDRLHHKAGVSAEKIIEIHGNELFVSCLKCGAKYSRDEVYHWILNGVKVPYCLQCQGLLKPDSIAFGQPMTRESSIRAFEMTMKCDLFIIAGTSLLVQPAALLPWKAKENGAKMIILNLSSTVYDQHADVLIRDKAAKAFGTILDRIEEFREYIQI